MTIERFGLNLTKQYIIIFDVIAPISLEKYALFFNGYPKLCSWETAVNYDQFTTIKSINLYFIAVAGFNWMARKF